jgi:DNA-binding NtrC family response regulator
MGKLIVYDWPGNVRELENTVERIAILKGIGMIMPEDLPEKIARPSLSKIVPGVNIPDDGIDFDAMVEAFEKQLLMQALVKASGVKSKAANLLRMNRTTLVEKVKKLRLEND